MNKDGEESVISVESDKFMKNVFNVKSTFDTQNEEYDNDFVHYYEYESTIDFKMEEIDFSTFKLHNELDKKLCKHCGHGGNRLALFKLNTVNIWIVVVNWCGCLTYNPSYSIRDFSYVEAIEYFIKHSDDKINAKKLLGINFTKSARK